MTNEKATSAELKARLIEQIEKLPSLAVGFSGGVDSTLLLAVAQQALGDRVVAFTATSPTHPQAELDNAADIAKGLGARHIFFPSDEMDDPAFTANGPDRCYHCKKRLFGAMRRVAEKEGIESLAHGANLDDLSDYRPGFRAAEELGVLAPLIEAKLTKSDIRRLARALGLPNWNRPAMACLATRIPYHVPIEPDVLTKIASAESVLKRHGILQCRVRHHGDTARIEMDPAQMHLLLDEAVRSNLVRDFKPIGYQYICLDLEGYISGKMNRGITVQPV